MRSRSYYMVLGVPPTENPGGIRQAFRELVKRYHPDRAGETGLRCFHEIVDAYRTIVDPERRRRYDQGLSHAESTSDMAAVSIALYPAMTSPTPLPQVTSSIRCSCRGHAAFEAALARVVRGQNGRDAPGDGSWQGIDVQAVLSPDDAARGGSAFLSVPSYGPCPTCFGSGREGRFDCVTCDGSRVLERDETVRVVLTPPVADAMLMDVPLRGLGVHHFYLRLHLRVAPAS
jgi:DnaJ-class molecular chaperone